MAEAESTHIENNDGKKYNFTVLCNDMDSSVAENIVEALEGRLNVKAFYEPRDGNAAMTKFKIMEISVECSELIFVLLSKQCMSCHWYERQVHTALQTSLDDPARRNCVIPVYIGIKKYEAPTALRTIAGVEYSQNPKSSFWQKMKKLFEHRKNRNCIFLESTSSSLSSSSGYSSSSSVPSMMTRSAVNQSNSSSQSGSQSNSSSSKITTRSSRLS